MLMRIRSLVLLDVKTWISRGEGDYYLSNVRCENQLSRRSWSLHYMTEEDCKAKLIFLILERASDSCWMLILKTIMNNRSLLLRKNSVNLSAEVVQEACVLPQGHRGHEQKLNCVGVPGHKTPLHPERRSLKRTKLLPIWTIVGGTGRKAGV